MMRVNAIVAGVQRLYMDKVVRKLTDDVDDDDSGGADDD